MAAFEYLSPQQQAEAYYLYQNFQKQKRKKRNHTLALLGIIGANVLGAKAALAKSDHPPISDAQMRRKKKNQAKLSTAAAVTGLAGLAGLGTSAIVRHNPKAVAKIPALKAKMNGESAEALANSIKDKSYLAGATSTGVGGIGSLNFAAIQREESRKRNQFKPKS